MFKAEQMSLPSEINQQAWVEWCADRKERRKPLTQRAAILAINKLSGFTHEEQAAAVMESIEHGWTGLFPRKGMQANARHQSNVDRRVAVSRATRDYAKAIDF